METETRTPVPALPTGTVTFLFTDIEGSTRMARELGPRWPEVLERHRQLIRAAITAANGSEVGTEGDSFFAGFDSATSAIQAAVEIQRGLAGQEWPGEPVRVRVGLHSGEAEVRDGSYVGVEVHRASRIGSAANGGQVVLSEPTRLLAGAKLPEGVELRELGQHRLRDVPEPESLYQLVIDGLTDERRALRTMETPDTLPEKLTSFLGREREIAEVTAELAEARLLTLSGPGGTGKTRLSIEVARRLKEQYPDGVYFIDLSAIDRPEIVGTTISHELGLPDRGGRDPLERLISHLKDRCILLVLDNFEQITDAAPVVAELLKGAPRVSVMVTSRSPLRVYGEREYPVPTLRFPDPEKLPPLEALSQYESVALFIERATAVQPSFQVTNENAPAVAEICVRLDGLPLAIELAAARIRVLTPQAILERLEDRLGLLSSGMRDLPARQQTLRGAIAWSYDLLDAPERALFECLGTFVGGASLEAIEAVCTGSVSADLLDTLASLVDKSLVRQIPDEHEEAHFAMLETIREFAIERLTQSGSADAMRKLHAEVFLARAEESRPRLMSAESGTWLDRLEHDHGNLRAGLGWVLAHAATEMALRYVAALWRFWQRRGHLREGMERAEQALALPDAAEHPELLGDAFEAAGGLAYWMADQPTALRWYQAWVDHARSRGDRPALADALYSLAFAYLYTPGRSTQNLERAREVVSESLDLYREAGNRHGEALALWGLSNTWYHDGFDDEAQAKSRRYGEDALAIFQDVGDTFMTGWAAYTIAISHLSERQDELATPRLREALRVFADANDVTGYTLIFDALSAVLLLRGDRTGAARFAGATAQLERSTGTGLNPLNRETGGIDTRTLASEADTSAVFASGERAPTEELVREGLKALGADS